MPLFRSTVLLFAFAFGGCVTLPETPSSDPLVETRWQLDTIDRPGQPSVILDARQRDAHWVAFRDDGTLSLGLDCNRGRSNWTRRADADTSIQGELTIGDIAATRALCPPPSYGEEMAAALPLALDYAIGDDGSLRVRTRTATYIFRAR